MNATTPKRISPTLINLIVLASLAILGLIGYLLYNNMTKEEATAGAIDPKTKVRDNIGKYITADIDNHSKTGLNSPAFGCLVTIRNSTDYTIDSVKVNIEYIHDNGKLLHTQDVDMGIARPKSKFTWNVPNLLNTTPFIKLVAIKSTDLGFPEWKFINEGSSTDLKPINEAKNDSGKSNITK